VADPVPRPISTDALTLLRKLKRGGQPQGRAERLSFHALRRRGLLDVQHHKDSHGKVTYTIVVTVEGDYLLNTN